MEQAPEQPRDAAPPRTTSVLALLAGAALIFSYLVSYALTNALIVANLMQRWAPGHDPRPRRMLLGFAALMFAFMTVGSVARWLSRRQLARIDEMDDGDAQS